MLHELMTEESRQDKTRGEGKAGIPFVHWFANASISAATTIHDRLPFVTSTVRHEGRVFDFC